QHLHTEQQLALKLLHAAVVSDEVALTRFRREARAPARIASEHVVSVTDAAVAPELGGVPFLVLELLRGQSLEDVSTERGPLPGPRKPCAGVGAGVDAGFARCWAREPQGRRPRAGAAVTELARALRGAEDAPPSAVSRPGLGAPPTARSPREEGGERTAFSA